MMMIKIMVMLMTPTMMIVVFWVITWQWGLNGAVQIVLAMALMVTPMIIMTTVLVATGDDSCQCLHAFHTTTAAEQILLVLVCSFSFRGCQLLLQIIH